MRASTSLPVVAGVDVGGSRKGFHAVALNAGQYHDRFASRDANQVVRWCVETIGAAVIAVDAPCRWSLTGKSRLAERELHAQGISCFFTPTRESAREHPKNNFGWVFSGQAVFAGLEKTHPLCRAVPGAGEKCCLETYPHAVTWHLRGGSADAKQKRAQRIELLKRHVIATEKLTNNDWRDAALCALVAHRAANGDTLKAFGDAQTGQIIVPAHP